jgi:3-hydroxyisobutyrate dehydrogenase
MNSTSSPRVGFIGLGSQGGPMARRIIEAGYPVTLWARRPATLEPFADTNAKTAGSPAELAAASDLVCVCVRDDADTEEVVDAVLGGLAAGGVIAVHSTVHPDTCRRLAERAQAGGVRLIDAPVSGGAPAAEAGRLLVMAGRLPPRRWPRGRGARSDAASRRRRRADERRAHMNASGRTAGR